MENTDILSQLDYKDIKNYFIGSKQICDKFSNLLGKSRFTKNLLVIHGVGGIGKSSHLKMFWRQCKKRGFPVAFALGNDSKSSIDVLDYWSQSFESSEINCTSFNKTFLRYKNLKKKVENIKEEPNQKKTATTEVIDAISANYPAIGTASKVGKILFDQLVGFVSESDRDLIQEPARQLTRDFVDDLSQIANKKRCVLMLDAYERAAHLEEWLCDLAQKLNPNVLLVIAGRRAPEWNHKWQTWIKRAEIEELKPISPENMETLIRRYCKYNCLREIDNSQVEEIVHFARGLPIAAIILMNTWVTSGGTPFQSIKPGVVIDLVKMFRIGLPEEIYPCLEAVATVRWFNHDILNVLTDQVNINTVYEQLQRFDVIRSGPAGFALHDKVREIIDESLRFHKPERHKELHKRASKYFRKLQKELEVVSSIDEKWQKLAIEEVFHLLQVSVDQGLNLLHVLFCNGLANFRYQFCQNLINDAKSLDIQDRRLKYRLNKYYTYRLKSAQLSPGHIPETKVNEIVRESDLDPEIQWEVFLSYASYLRFAAKHEKAGEYVYRSLELLRSFGKEESTAGCMVLLDLAGTYSHPSIAKEELTKRALHISHNIGEFLCEYNSHVELGHIYFTRQEYPKAKEMWLKALEIAKTCKNYERIADAFNRLAQSLIAMGELHKAKSYLNSAVKAAERLPDTLGGFKDKEMYIKRHFGVLHYISGNYDKAIKYLGESAETYRKRKSLNGFLRALVLLAECFYEIGSYCELKSVMAEIEKVTSKASLRDFVARSLVLRGDILLDDLIDYADHLKLNKILEMYKEAIRNALECNYNSLDDTIDRILWKLKGYLNQEGDVIGVFILKELIDFWKNEQIDGKFFSDIEGEKRKLVFSAESMCPESCILTKLEKALQTTVYFTEPQFWRGL